MNLKIHQVFAQADFFLSKTSIVLGEGTSRSQPGEDAVSHDAMDMIPANDFASELNVYLVLSRAVYCYLSGDGSKASNAELAAHFDSINRVFEDSFKVDEKAER